MEIDLDTIIKVVGAILTALITTIGVLWVMLWKREEKYSNDLKLLQDSKEAVTIRSIEAIKDVTVQLNALPPALVSITQMQTEQAKNWHSFKDEILKALRESK